MKAGQQKDKEKPSNTQNKSSSYGSAEDYDSEDNVDTNEQCLHQDLIINSDKQKSAQGAVFYVKTKSDQTKGVDRELVLKIYKQRDLKSYFKEKAVLNLLDDHFLKQKAVGTGFPEIISKKDNNKRAEILMSALGPNLRKLVKQCPGRKFSKTTTFMITLQLVSTEFCFDFNLFLMHLD